MDKNLDIEIGLIWKINDYIFFIYRNFEWFKTNDFNDILSWEKIKESELPTDIVIKNNNFLEAALKVAEASKDYLNFTKSKNKYPIRGFFDLSRQNNNSEEKEQKKETYYEVYCQKWIEKERGWGIRPDGYSLHLSKEDFKNYVDKYWERMPAMTPDEYSEPSGELKLIKVNKEYFDKIISSKNGIRTWDKDLEKYKISERK